MLSKTKLNSSSLALKTALKNKLLNRSWGIRYKNLIKEIPIHPQHSKNQDIRYPAKLNNPNIQN